MLTKLIGFSIKNKLIVGLFVLGLILFGSYELTKLPIDAVPDITNNQVQIITVAPSFGATDIERLITFPIEQANTNIGGIIEIRSFSRFGLSLVTIVFDDQTDLYWARQQVTERLQAIQSLLPTGIGSPELGPISTGLGEIYQYVVRPKKGYEHLYDVTELRTIQDWVIRRQLLGVKGVAEVSSFGGKVKQYEIAVSPAKLNAHNITINDIFSALEKNNQNTGGAYIEKGPIALFIRSEGLITSKEDIESIYITSTKEGTPLLIRNVADVTTGFATRYGALCYNDEGEVAGAIVMMLKGANSSEVIENIKDRVALIQQTLPEGVVIEAFLDRSKMVNNAIQTVQTNLIEGALIVIFVLVLFLGNLRAGLLVASVIPLSMLFAVILMNAFGVSGNLMSLGALDFGLIIDGAVIIVEAVMHQVKATKVLGLSTVLTKEEMDREVNHSAGKMMNSAVFGQAIILIVYLPIFALQGIEGKMFKPMAQTVAFALIGAFILSLTYVPMMSALFLSKKAGQAPNFSDRIMAKLEAFYRQQLRRAIRIPYLIISGVLVLFALSIGVLFSLGGEFIPSLEEGDFAVETRVLKGSNLNTTIESTQKAAKLLKDNYPEVNMVVTKIGSGEVPTDPMPMEASDMMIILKDKSEWTSAKTFNELSAKMEKTLSDLPEIAVSFQYPVQMRFNELMTGARQDVVCKVFGENLDTLVKYAGQLNSIVTTIDGCENYFVEPVSGVSQIVVQYDRAKIAQYQLSINDINQAINTAFAGQQAGLVFEEEKRISLMVRLQTDDRSSLEDVKNLLIPSPLGVQLPLHQLAEVSLVNGPNQIQREDAKRRIVVGFNTSGRDVESIVTELKTKVSQTLFLPAGYFISYGGAFENLNEAKKRLSIAVPISLGLIFILLYFAFTSIKQGLLIYTAIPLAAIGGILLLALRGMPFSISAGIGFIALFGVSVLNGIVLLSEFNRLKKEGMTNRFKIILKGTSLRLRPVLMTASVASLGFLPMALSNGAGAEVQRPLATVVIGGLILATILTLIVLPILYSLSEKKRKPKALIALVVIFFVWSPQPSTAQTTIRLEASIDSALQHNALLKSEQLRAEYQQKIRKTYAAIEKAIVSAEGGQFNSSFNDLRVGLSQSISFPTVYSNQKKVNQGEFEKALLSVSLKEAELKKLTTQKFYTIIYLKEKERLLQKIDSSYQLFIKKAALRMSMGESNVLEKSFAELQRGSISLQLNELRQALFATRLEFNLVLNTATIYEPYSVDKKLTLTLAFDSSLLNRHPSLKIIEKQRTIAEQNKKLERARLLPNLGAGIYSMSMIGTGADNLTYNSAIRFTSGQLTLGLPLFFGSQRARINASSTLIAVSNSEYYLQRQALNNQLIMLTNQYRQLTEALQYFEQSALPNATIIYTAANAQLSQGTINYLEWAMLTNQAIGVETTYLDTISLLNECIASILYLTIF